VTGDRVLIVGVCLSDEVNTAVSIVEELAASRQWRVEQRWAAIGRSAVPAPLARYVSRQLGERKPKFAVLNELVSGVRLSDYRFVVVCDDDIVLPPGFLDAYLSLVTRFDFAISQPARTHDSFIDHAFVEQLDGVDARRTRFVEIGPVFCLRADAFPVVMPFDEASPMGWGYDLAWPCLAAAAGLYMGVVDATPVAHNIRRPLTHYARPDVEAQMQAYLASRPHLEPEEAFVILESYA
jgi:hypothetical protein